MPWEKSYDENDVLERAMHAFWAHGYEATSMSDLVEATGINRGSIYAAYTNKRTLFMRALRHYDQVHRIDHLDRIAHQRAPREAIIATFESAGKNTSRSKIPGGCLLVNTALELSPHDREIRDFVDDSLLGVEEFFCAMIEAAKQEGTVKSSVDSRQSAQGLLGLFLGLRVLARSAPRKAVVDAIIVQAERMLA